MLSVRLQLVRGAIDRRRRHLGLSPIVISQYSSTTSRQVSYQMAGFSKVTIRFIPIGTVALATASWACRAQSTRHM
jgi:hypothetical protein